LQKRADASSVVYVYHMGRGQSELAAANDWTADRHAVKVPGGGKPLSVLASSPNNLTPASYQLSEESREVLESVLAEDMSVDASGRAHLI